MGIFDKPNYGGLTNNGALPATNVPRGGPYGMEKPPATPMPEEKLGAIPEAQPGPAPLPPFMKPPPRHPAMPETQEAMPGPMPGRGPRYGPQGGMAPPGIGPVNRQEMKMRTPNGGMPEAAHKTREAMPSPMSRPIEAGLGPGVTPMDAPMASAGPRYPLNNRDDVEFDEG